MLNVCCRLIAIPQLGYERLDYTELLQMVVKRRTIRRGIDIRQTAVLTTTRRHWVPFIAALETDGTDVGGGTGMLTVGGVLRLSGSRSIRLITI